MLGIRSDRIVVGRTLFDGWLYAENGRIVAVTDKRRDADEIYDFTGKYVSAGFIDLHTHGGGGHAFLDSNADEVAAGCRFHLAHGTTSILPTVSASPFPVMRCAVEAISQAKHGGKAGARIVGAHMEGPYLSAKQCGAQCPDFITPPRREDYEALIADYGADIARWTYAPEHDAGGEFCRYLAEHNILPSAGHTDAVYRDIEVAIASGCRLVTHLYSCTSTVTRDHGFRSLGVIESAFLRDELYVEIIADGKHLPPDLIRMILKIKGTDRVALITDSLSIAGTGIREGVMGGTPYLVEDGVCKLRDRSAFAGSIATADVLLRTLVRDCGVSIPEAVYMLTSVPAAILGLPRGELKVGYDADVVVFDGEMNVGEVFVCGEKIR